MVWFNRKRQQSVPSGAPSAQAPTAAYYAPGQIRISHLDFDQPGPVTQGARIHRIDVGNLVGASVFESALCSSAHVDALVFSELAESMQVIERKFHGGQYDAQAMPLVEAFLSELHVLAQIQVERNSIVDRRIADLRRANIMAYQAVCEERALREEGIDKARMYEWHVVAASHERREAQMRRKQAKTLQQDEERAAKAEAKAQRAQEKGIQKTEAKAAREERSSAAKAVRAKRREDRSAAWQKVKQRRYERRVRKEQMRAERERLKWQVRQERSEMDLDQLRAEKEVARAERAARQAALEANTEIARAQAHAAIVREEWAQRELEHMGAAPVAQETLSMEETTAEMLVAEGDAGEMDAFGETVAIEKKAATEVSREEPSTELPALAEVGGGREQVLVEELTTEASDEEAATEFVELPESGVSEDSSAAPEGPESVSKESFGSEWRAMANKIAKWVAAVSFDKQDK